MPAIEKKSWQKEFEKEVYEGWKREKKHKFDVESSKKVYSIDTPPPYVNTPVHIGQATTYVLMDFFARFRRMLGSEVLFPLGLDRNGLPIEMAAEKKFKVRLMELPREKALELCKTVLDESSLKTLETFLKLGISFNSWETGKEIGMVYETDSPDYRALTQETFIDLWTKNLIYEAKKITNFCPGCGTTIADSEIEYVEKQTYFNEVIFRVKETGEKIIIGTTRPELICSCGMVIFNPADKRYAHLEGKTALTPIYEKEIPIKAHPMADMEKGTGLVMMCSAGDTSDIRFFMEMKLEPVIAIDITGRMNEKAGFLKGLKVKAAREKIIEELKSRGLLVKQTQVMHRSPICERSKDAIEFIELPELYLKQVEFKDEMKKLAGELNFFAPQSRQILLNWIDAVSIDWPVSRRRYYGTEIPLWYCKKCNHAIVPEKGRYYQPWKEPAPVKACPKCGSSEFRGEERVFDTWFDSSNTPLYILGYSRNHEFFTKHSPCTLRPQGKEIVRTWLYYTMLKAYLLTKKPIFEDAWINYHIVDEHGRKMSKSLGNVIDPQEVLNRFGAEPFRLWAAIEGDLTKTDFKCSFERIEGAQKTLTKLWNVARFISMFPLPEEEKIALQESDKWIIEEVNGLIEFAKESYLSYDFHSPATRIKHFVWETFASHYVELVKNRAYNRDNVFSQEEVNAAHFTLHYVLRMILRLFSPVIPFITFILYKDIYGEDVHSLAFPEPEKRFKPAFKAQEIEEINTLIWKAKKEAGVSLKDKVSEVIINEKFKAIEKELVLMHSIEKITYTKDEEMKVIVKQLSSPP